MTLLRNTIALVLLLPVLALNLALAGSPSCDSGDALETEACCDAALVVPPSLTLTYICACEARVSGSESWVAILPEFSKPLSKHTVKQLIVGTPMWTVAYNLRPVSYPSNPCVQQRAFPSVKIYDLLASYLI